jgi:MFS family permease
VSRPAVSSSSGEKRILPLVYLATLGTWGSYALIIVVLPFRFEELGLSVVEYGAALGIYALGTLATEGLWGYLAFRIGSARALGILGGATAVSMLALGFARSFEVFAALLGLYGMLVVYSTPLIRWMGMTAAGPGRASKGLGLLGLFFGVGLSSGTAAGPVIYSLGGFWLSVVVAASVFAVSTVPLLLVPWSSVRLPKARTRAVGSFRMVVERQFVLATGLVILYFMAYTLVTNFLQYYSIDLFHGTVDEAGYVIGAARGAAVISGVVLGSAVDRWGAHRAAPAGFLLLAGGALGTWLAPNYTGMIAASLLAATGAGWLGVTLLPMALAHIPTAHQGTAVGVFGSFEDLGLILGPVLLGVVYAQWGPRELFPVVAALSLLAAILALAARGSRGTVAMRADSP